MQFENGTGTNMSSGGPEQSEIEIRRIQSGDIPAIIALDERVTEIAKPEYWQEIYERYSTRRMDERFFLVACSVGEAECKVLGYIVGAVRGWEFGSAPSGWIFGFAVEADTRQQGIGEKLFMAISAEFAAADITTIRTMVPRQNALHMAFFRSEGMVAGPYIQLEMEL